MKQKIYLALAVTGAMLMAFPPTAGSGTTHSGPLTGYTIRVDPSPFRISILDGQGLEIFTQRARCGKGSVFLERGCKKIHVLDVLEERIEGETRIFQCSTEDPLTEVEISVDPDRVGAVRVEITPLTPDPPDRIGDLIFSPREEHLHGLTERLVDGPQDLSWMPWVKPGLDRRGHVIDMYVKPTLSLYVPFYLASGGYGLYAETTWPGSFDMALRDREGIRFAFEGCTLRYHIFPGTFPEILDLYTELTGRPWLPPRWAFGVWRWRDEHENRATLYDGTPNPSPYNSQVYEDIAMFEELGIPCHVYWVDRPWATGSFGFDDFDPDPERLPDFEGMVEWLDSREIRFLLWTAPWTYGEMRAEAAGLGYLAPGSPRVIDFTNPAALDWLASKYRHLLDAGVVGFKLDRAEEVIPSSPADVYFDGRTGREVHNDFPRLYAKAYHEGLAEHFDEFIVLPRAGFAGSQQYAIFWGGDTASTNLGLRSAVIASQRAGLMGMPIWGSDTGGYNNDPSREVFARWLEMSCFNPIMEIGGRGAHAPWDMRRLPHYDEDLIDIYRTYALLHTALMDYSYELAVEAHETGMPMVRPMFLSFPDDERCWREWDQFFYGDEILVAPVWKSYQRLKMVYLPQGRWTYYWSGKTYEGPRTLIMHTPLDRIPIFTPEGSEPLPPPEELGR